MKLLKRVLFLLFILFATVPDTYSQDCKQILKDYAVQLSKYNKPDAKKVYLMEMSVNSVFRPGAEQQNMNVNIRLLVTADKMEYQSEYISFYMDHSDAFVVLHPQKTIIRSDGGISGSQNNYTSLVKLQDSLMKYSSVESCKEMTIEGRKQKEIILKTSDEFKRKTKINKITYYYDLKEKRLMKGVIAYTESSPKKQDIVVYKKMDFDYKSFPFKKASQRILDSKGSFLPQFKEYQLIDNRNKK